MSDPILSEIDLAGFRDLNEGSLPHRARVLTATLVRQAGGIETVAYPEASSVPAIACRVQRATADVIARIRADQFAPRPVSVIAFALDDVSEEQLAVGETRVLVDGETNGVAWSMLYDVIGVEPHRSYHSQRRAIGVPSLDSTSGA